MSRDDIDLGDIAKDIITGYEGVVIGRTRWLTGCDRLTLQARGLKDGKPVEVQSFDITQCKLVKAGAVPLENAGTRLEKQPRARAGGPRPTLKRY